MRVHAQFIAAGVIGVVVAVTVRADQVVCQAVEANTTVRMNGLNTSVPTPKRISAFATTAHLVNEGIPC